MFTSFGGPVFGPEDSASLLFVFLIAAIPIIILLTTLGFVIYDAAKKKLRLPTKILLGLSAALLIYYFAYANRVF